MARKQTTTEEVPSPGQPSRTRKSSGARAKRAGLDETTAIVEALLQSRGSRGATEEELQTVVAWAERTHEESEAIASESKPRRAPRGAGQASPRSKAAQARQKAAREERLKERRTQNALDRALLEGVLAGRVFLDIQEGQIVFLHQDHQRLHAATRAGQAATAQAAAASGIGDLP